MARHINTVCKGERGVMAMVKERADMVVHCECTHGSVAAAATIVDVDSDLWVTFKP